MQRVTVIKYLLIAGAIGLTLWLFLSQDASRLPLDIVMPAIPEEPAPLPTPSLNEQPLETVDTSTVLLEPRYTGRDITGQSWEIKADQAEQDGTLDTETLVLDNVTAKLSQANGEELLFSADEGLFKQSANSLTLNDHVRVQGYGLELTTPSLTGNMDTRAVQSTGPLTVTGIFGRFDTWLEAGYFEMTHAGNRLFFSQRIRGRLTPRAELEDNE